MLSAPPVPAAPTAVDPLLRRSSAEPTALGVPVTGLQILVLGLSAVTSSAAVVLAGCGARGFTVVDDDPVTWADSRAGAFDVAEVGRPRDLCTRRRIRAANREAAPVTWSDRFAPQPDRPVTAGQLIVRTVRADDGLPPAADPGAAALDPTVDPPVALSSWPAMDLPAEAARLPRDLPLLDVLHLRGYGPGAVLLAPATTWSQRPCPACMGHRLRTAEIAAGRSPAAASLRSAAAAHTALAAALIAQHALQVGMGVLPAGQQEGAGLLVRPGSPFSVVVELPLPRRDCPLCGGG